MPGAKAGKKGPGEARKGAEGEAAGEGGSLQPPVHPLAASASQGSSSEGAWVYPLQALAPALVLALGPLPLVHQAASSGAWGESWAQAFSQAVGALLQPGALSWAEIWLGAQSTQEGGPPVCPGVIQGTLLTPGASRAQGRLVLALALAQAPAEVRRG